MKTLLILPLGVRTLVLGTLTATTKAQTTGPATLPDDAAIQRILVERIDEARQSVGMVVGIVTPSGRRIVAHGRFGVADSRPVDGSTVFEIGSVTKIFTSLL